MTALTNLPPTHRREPSTSSNSESSEPESQLIGLMVSPDIPAHEDGLHGSRFIECMDYSITSFDPELCAIKRPSQIINAPVDVIVPSSTTPSPPSRRSSRGFGSLIRMLSLKNAPVKRDVSPNSTTTKLFQFKPESPSCDLINSSKLARRISQHKARRTSSPLVIETGQAGSWSTGLKSKTFTPFFLLNSTPSPVSLSSSASGFSGESSVALNSKAKTYLLSETLLGTPRPKRSNSMSEVHHPQPHLPSSKVDAGDLTNPLLGTLSRSSFSRKSFGSQRRDRNDKSHIPSSSLILSKLSQVRKKTTDKSS